MSFQQPPKLLPLLLLAIILLNGCAGVGPASSPTTDGPAVLMVVPQSNGVATNRAVGVVFNRPMDPNTINTNSFVVPGIAGTVTYDSVNRIALFKASPDFAPSTTYNASITTAAKDTSGLPLLAQFDFSFTTRATSDLSPPKPVAVNVGAGATCIPLTQKIVVTFDEQMDPTTITPSTVMIEGVASTVTYDVNTRAATIAPNAPLSSNTTYTITVTVGAKDLGGVPLAAAFHQTFTTGPCAAGQVPTVPLCPFMGNFEVLAGSTVTNTGSSVILGAVGVSPGSAVTGFPPGSAVAIHQADGAAGSAQIALTTAYLDAASRTGATPVSGDLVGQTLTPGVYRSTSTLAVSGDVTFDAKGDPDAVFIIQIGSSLTTASASHIILANGAKACNIFWQVGSSATLGTNSVFKGNILALTSITLTTGANLEGRALARNGAVTLDTNAVAGCTCP